MSKLRTDIFDRKEDIKKWINENQSKAFMCRMLKCKPETLNFWLDKCEIVYKGNMGGKGIKSDSKRKSAIEYLNSNGHINSHKLMNKLIEDGLKEKKCEECGLSKWNGKDIPLELHHMDGNKYNNKLENLKILCRNCHGQEENHCAKNIGKYK